MFFILCHLLSEENAATWTLTGVEISNPSSRGTYRQQGCLRRLKLKSAHHLMHPRQTLRHQIQRPRFLQCHQQLVGLVADTITQITNKFLEFLVWLLVIILLFGIFFKNNLQKCYF